MAFEDVKYETDNGSIVLLRVDESLVTVIGTEPAGDPSLSIHGIINGNRSREFGVHPRGVTLSRERGTAPDTFKSYKFIPVLPQDGLSDAGFQIGAGITIGTQLWQVSDQVNESLN